MRHIKIFEDYSDEELNDLIGDLEGIGHKGKLTQGEDFGFGTSLKEENDGGWFFTMSEETIEILLKKGILKKSISPRGMIYLEFLDPQEWTEGEKPHIKKHTGSDNKIVWRIHMPSTPSTREVEILGKLAEKLGKVII
jgi:hypothetical protein